MSSETVYLIGVMITMGIVTVAIWYLRRPLQAILVELCGTAKRAEFWSAFSHLTLFLVPLIAVLSPGPGAAFRQPVLFAVYEQIKAGVTGFVVSLVILGALLSWYIVNRFKEPRAPDAGGHAVLQG